MRILVGCLFFLLVADAPQTSVALHARYGQSDVERFLVRSDLALAVEGRGGVGAGQSVDQLGINHHPLGP